MDRELFAVSLLSLLYFIFAAINKILNFNDVIDGFIRQTTPLLRVVMASPPPYILYQVVIVCVILLQLMGSAIVLAAAYQERQNVGLNRAARLALYGLIVFSIVATLLYHSKLEKEHLIIALANSSVIAGLWLLSNKYNFSNIHDVN